MTLSERLRSQIADITPRIPDHNRRELEEIASALERATILLEVDDPSACHAVDQEDGA